MATFAISMRMESWFRMPAANSFRCLFLMAAASLILGCRAPAPFGQVDLSVPSWKGRTGQALWRPGREKPEIVGDLIVAKNDDGRAYAQFSKALPIATARLSPGGWEADFPPQDKHYSAPGRPPKRIVWLQLLRVLNGQTASANWITQEKSDEFVLEDPTTGERLEVHF